MPRLILALNARADLVRLREFLQPKNPVAAKRAAEAIKRQLQILIQQPGIGRPVLDLPPEFRELVIDFGDSGYIARYHVSPDLVAVLAIRHQREVGY
ncbi:MAG: type II toxin-antitoxin system RelE/ParE family toxin [Betaproteobacteria bacterium]|jgi:plasmid stabilization system protein ParE